MNGTANIQVPPAYQARTEFLLLERVGSDRPWRLPILERVYETIEEARVGLEVAVEHNARQIDRVYPVADDQVSEHTALRRQQLREAAAVREFKIFVREVPALTALDLP